MTGWKVDGTTHWLWKFSNKKVCISHIDKSRLYEKGIDYHNNHIEQQIRPDVIFRKITFGNRSIKGAENHSVITSILQTAKLNNLDPIATLQNILLPANKNPLARILAPPNKQNRSFIESRNKKVRLVTATG